MRSFVNLPKSESKNLNRQFPEIFDLISLEKVAGYNQRSVCVFDHWLSIDEGKMEIDQISLGGEELHNQNLFNFIVELSGRTTTHLVKIHGRGKSPISFRNFLSRAGLEKKLKPQNHLVTDSLRFILLFPELETIYAEGCDFTHHFYSKNNANNELIEKIAKQNNLFVLK